MSDLQWNVLIIGAVSIFLFLAGCVSTRSSCDRIAEPQERAVCQAVTE